MTDRTRVECPLCPPGLALVDCPGHPTQNCGICGSFLPRPADGATKRVCPKCDTEFEVTPAPRLPGYRSGGRVI